MKIILPGDIKICSKCDTGDNAIFYNDSFLLAGEEVEIGKCELRELIGVAQNCLVIRIVKTDNEYHDKWLRIQDIDPALNVQEWEQRMRRWRKQHVIKGADHIIILFNKGCITDELSKAEKELASERNTIELEVHAALFSRFGKK